MVKGYHLGKADTERLETLGPKEEELKYIDSLKEVHRSCEFNFVSDEFCNFDGTNHVILVDAVVVESYKSKKPDKKRCSDVIYCMERTIHCMQNQFMPQIFR